MLIYIGSQYTQSVFRNQFAGDCGILKLFYAVMPFNFGATVCFIIIILAVQLVNGYIKCKMNCFIIISMMMIF